MRKLVPFKLDPLFRVNHSPQVPCADCGKVIEFRHARIVIVDISEKKRRIARKCQSTTKNLILDLPSIIHAFNLVLPIKVLRVLERKYGSESAFGTSG